jgi:sugar phosphate isomerase/epimerase
MTWPNGSEVTVGVDRRGAIAALAAFGLAGLARADGEPPAESAPWPISLAQWSLHRQLRAGTVDVFEFPTVARQRFGLAAIELVNQFYSPRMSGRAVPGDWASRLRKRADDAGVKSLLIMCDGEGRLGDPDAAARTQAIENHRPWLDAAATLGCQSIRVNAASEGSGEEQRKLAADGLGRLADLAKPMGLSVIVENHGGLSSDGAWLAATLRAAGRGNLGSLPDFGNFRVAPDRWSDRYRGVEALLPLARGVSAKSHDFDANGDESSIDYSRMMALVAASGYRGAIGVEYEGVRLSEDEGVRATIRLLERLGCRRAG